MNAEESVAALLAALGWRDAELEGTPARVAEFLGSYVPDPLPAMSTFPHPGDDPVVFRDLPYHSLCVHHLLPFFGHVSLAYVPSGRIAGLSGVAAVVKNRAQRPQLQERMVAQIADALEAALQPRGLVVRVTARQMCMEMRGVEMPGTIEAWAIRGNAPWTEQLRTMVAG